LLKKIGHAENGGIERKRKEKYHRFATPNRPDRFVCFGTLVYEEEDVRETQPPTLSRCIKKLVKGKEKLKKIGGVKSKGGENGHLMRE